MLGQLGRNTEFTLQKKPKYIFLRKYNNIALTSRKNLREQNKVSWRW